MRTKNRLAEVLQILSNNAVKAEDLVCCETTCGVLDKFVHTKPAKINFVGKLGDATVTSTMNVVVKNASGEIVEKSGLYYTLTLGKYTYSATCTGAVDIVDKEFEITLENVATTSSTSLTIVFEAANE